MMRNIVLFSLVIFLCASVAMAQNRVGLFLGASSTTSSYQGGDYFSTSLTPSRISPAAGVQFCPMCVVSGGVEYFRLRANGSRSGVDMAKMDGTPLITSRSVISTVDNAVAGVVSVGYGKKIHPFGFGMGGVALVQEHGSSTLVANDPKYTEDAAQTQANNPPKTKNYPLPVYGGGGGIRLVKGHFGGEIRVGYLVPFGIVITPRIGFYF